jgi:hypothetical protein
LFQAWQCANFGKDEAFGVIPWEKFGGEGSLLFKYYVFLKWSTVAEVYCGLRFLRWDYTIYMTHDKVGIYEARTLTQTPDTTQTHQHC